MRDILTVIAGAVLLLLAAALVAPPFVDWPAHRDRIERALARTAGTEVRTEGRIEVRLLPWPRMRFESLRLGPGRDAPAALAANHVKADLALTALLGGEVRFTDVRIGRAEITLPAGLGGEIRLPRGFLTGLGRRGLAVEDLRVTQLLVTFTVPATGRTDQFHADAVRIEGRSLAGPWRAEGFTGGIPFRLAAGASGEGEGTSVKVTGGGGASPRFDVEARIAFEPSTLRHLGPLVSVAGTARIALGPPAQSPTAALSAPLSLQASFRSRGSVLELDPVSVESGEGGSALQLAGTGELRMEEPRLVLALAGKRFDADAYLASAAGEALRLPGAAWRWPDTGLPVDVDVKLDSFGVAAGDWAKLAVEASLGGGTALVRKFEATGPGQTRLTLEGRLGAEGTASGRVSLSAASPDRLGAYLKQAGVARPELLAALGGPALEVSGDFTHAPPVTSARDVRIRLGEALVTGVGRYTAAEAGARARLEAQVTAEGVDIARLPAAEALAGLYDLDIGLALDARGVRYGSAPGAGRIAARVRSEGRSLVVDPLEIADLAGAQAHVAGRLAPDGSGRIEGNVRAETAAPLLDLIGTVWAGSRVSALPGFVRGGSLDLRLLAERRPAGSGREPDLSLALRGKAAAGDLTAEVILAGARAQRLSARLAAADTGPWFERPDASVLKRPSTLAIDGARAADDRFPWTVTGEIAGTRIETTRPLVVAGEGERIESGALAIRSPDLSPVLVLLSDAAAVSGPVPADLAVEIGREGNPARVSLSGRVANAAVQGEFSVPAAGPVEGALSLDRLSLPWLAGALVLNPTGQGRNREFTSSARFGPELRVVRPATATLSVGRLELGRGFQGDDARLTLTLGADGLALRGLSARMGGGRLATDLSIRRREGAASFEGEGSLDDVDLAGLAGAAFPFKGRLSGNLSFGASGETLGALAANLAGSGQVQVTALRIDGADPSGLDRAARRALAEADPLARGRLEGLVAEELARGPLVLPSVAAPATMVGGALRIGPLKADLAAGLWDGAASLDVKSSTVDVRGLLTVKAASRGWTGSPPAILLGWKGPLARPAREIDTAPLVTAVAAVVLQRELERIEDFEADANERARRAGRLEMDRARKAAEAARQARLRDEQRAADESARQARLREEANRERARGAAEALPTPPARLPVPEPPPPLDIRPAPQVRPQPGGLQQP